jgi:hypothetical protein
VDTIYFRTNTHSAAVRSQPGSVCNPSPPKCVFTVSTTGTNILNKCSQGFLVNDSGHFSVKFQWPHCLTERTAPVTAVSDMRNLQSERQLSSVDVISKRRDSQTQFPDVYLADPPNSKILTVMFTLSSTEIISHVILRTTITKRGILNRFHCLWHLTTMQVQLRTNAEYEHRHLT